MAFALVTGVDFISTVTDTSFRLFKAISDSMTALGFTASADTGQVNWTTVTYPGTGVRTAYEIRKLNPTSAAPIYVKIQYFYVGTQGCISFQVGTGSNGSGTLTGVGTNPVLDCIVTPPAAASGKTTWALAFAADGGGFAMLSGGSATVNRFFLAIEMLRNEDGSQQTNQVCVVRQSGTAANASDGTWHDLNTLTWQTYRSVPVSYFDTATASGQSTSYNGIYPFGPPVFITPNGLGWTIMLLGVNGNDFVPNAIIGVPRFDPAVLTKYQFFRPADATSPGSFGNASYNYYAPMIYWQ